jgi:hypothetical protein
VALSLKVYDLLELVDKLVALSTNPTTLESHEKNEIKSKRVILDSLKDHLITHLFEKNKTKYMFDSLIGLFQSTNMNKKMVLKNRLRFVQISRYDNFSSYFMMIT